ncbi:hypothetical protein C8J56DRAFT_894940 [Mycena floridula]|nr:hypothetical protein C8J56DRAFT_894940 [Mycena floridula]
MGQLPMGILRLLSATHGDAIVYLQYIRSGFKLARDGHGVFIPRNGTEISAGMVNPSRFLDQIETPSGHADGRLIFGVMSEMYISQMISVNPKIETRCMLDSILRIYVLNRRPIRLWFNLGDTSLLDIGVFRNLVSLHTSSPKCALDAESALWLIPATAVPVGKDIRMTGMHGDIEFPCGPDSKSLGDKVEDNWETWTSKTILDLLDSNEIN